MSADARPSQGADLVVRPLPGFRLPALSGRNPGESHRAATPLELLFDLTLVVAFGTAGSQMAHALAAGHVAVALLGFAFAMFAVMWAWINFTWFASAYDTDDWFVRLAVMVQMIGVMVVALGLPSMFAGLEHGWQIDNRVMVAGYVVLRLPMVALWLRAARDDVSRRSTCLTYAVAITIAQIGWIGLAVAGLPFLTAVVGVGLLFVIEMLAPFIAETRHAPTPWHPHHIAERYGLLAIITFGEGIIGTVSALQAVIEADGWSLDAALIGLAGVSLTMGLWWIYFAIPFGELLAGRQDRAFAFGYGHMLAFASIAAMGAGLHVAAYLISHHSHLGELGTILSVAIPVGLFVVVVRGIGHALRPMRFTARHGAVFAAMVLALVAAPALAAAGAPLSVCLLIVTVAPWLVVIGDGVQGEAVAAEVRRAG